MPPAAPVAPQERPAEVAPEERPAQEEEEDMFHSTQVVSRKDQFEERDDLKRKGKGKTDPEEGEPVTKKEKKRCKSGGKAESSRQKGSGKS